MDIAGAFDGATITPAALTPSPKSPSPATSQPAEVEERRLQVARDFSQCFWHNYRRASVAAKEAKQ